MFGNPHIVEGLKRSRTAKASVHVPAVSACHRRSRRHGSMVL